MITTLFIDTKGNEYISQHLEGNIIPDFKHNYKIIELPKGSIEKLIGRPLKIDESFKLI